MPKHELQTSVLLHMLHAIRSLFTIVEIVGVIHKDNISTLDVKLYTDNPSDGWNMHIVLSKSYVPKNA